MSDQYQGQKVAVLDVPEWWKMHRIVWGVGGVSPTITTKMDFAPNILVEGRDDGGGHPQPLEKGQPGEALQGGNTQDSRQSQLQGGGDSGDRCELPDPPRDRRMRGHDRTGVPI